jgi:hypothetical protein
MASFRKECSMASATGFLPGFGEVLKWLVQQYQM